MNGGLQAKLLRVLQEREIEPLGAERPEPVDVRVIAATNADLRHLVAAGRFRDDLYYRLHIVPIAVPPLRERLEDIPMLVNHFVQKHAARAGKPLPAVSDDVIAFLQAYRWPGNARELENVMERAVVLSSGPTITREAISIESAAAPHSISVPSFKLRENIEWIERETIRQALEVSAAKGQAARLMGISPRALSHYLAKYRSLDRLTAGS
jgi:transcriptional regulator with PAS, ATPase and Fis domain